MKNTLLFACFFLLHTPIFTQQFYIRLDDASGFNTDIYQDSLEAAAEHLVAAFPDSTYRDSFKVYDFGFYLHQEVTEGGYPEAFQQMIDQVGEMSPYYLLFGKQTDKAGIYTKFWVEMKLPETRKFSCLTESLRKLLAADFEAITNSIYEHSGRSPYDFWLAEVFSIDSLEKFIIKTTLCCESQNRNGCNTCPNSNQIVNFFTFNGFKKISLDNLSISPNFPPTIEYDIINYCALNIVLDKDTFDINQNLKDFFMNYLTGGNNKGIISNDAFFCLPEFLPTYNNWSETTLNPTAKIWLHATNSGDKKYLLYKIIGHVNSTLNTNTTTTILEGFIPPPEFNHSRFDASISVNYVKNIFNRNGLNIDIRMEDKEPLKVSDLWIRIIRSRVASVFRFGYSLLHYIEPTTIKINTVTEQHGTYANFEKMNEYVQGSNPLNYQVAWVVAHEFLHQLCIKAYYHISICSGSNIVIMNPFKEMEKFIHYNDKRAHLNTAADNEKVRVLNLLPSTEPTTLKNYEEILEEHLLLINYYRILLLVPYSNFVKKLYAQKFLDEINTVFKIK